jgi:Putative auto-transporter adhesin, head GIN domain
VIDEAAVGQRPRQIEQGHLPCGAKSGGCYGAVSLSGSGTISMSAPTTGSYADVLIFQPAANTQALSASGSSMAGVTGTIYAPGAQLNVSGSAHLVSAIDVNTLSLSGSSVADIVTLSSPTRTDTINASYSGDTNFKTSSATVSQTVNLSGDVVVLSASSTVVDEVIGILQDESSSDSTIGDLAFEQVSTIKLSRK